MTPDKRAVIKVSISGNKSTLGINHSRRIYSILRRYTPEVAEGGSNICYAELTGLRTFFKMSYVQMMTVIKKEVEKELRKVRRDKEMAIRNQEFEKAASLREYPYHTAGCCPV